MANFIPFGEAGLFDEFMQNLDVAAFETPLLRVGKIVRWEQFEPELHAAVLPAQPKGPGGRPRFAPLLMFKVLVLQSLHGLADDALSYQITDRHSFRAFLGLTPGDAVPDGQTIADFRAALGVAGSFQRLFEAFLLHLQQHHGLGLAKAGVIVDATFVEVPRQRNTREQNTQIKAGEIPPAFAQNAKLRAHKDTDARWALKDFQAYYGYKNHCKVDVADKLILAAQVTAANVHDSRVFAELIQMGDGSVHADSAYKSARNDADLTAKGVRGHINIQGSKAHPLSEEQKAANRARSKVRCRVEHVFAQMRGSMHALWQRCIGLVRNTACLQLANLVYNMVRLEQITRLKITHAA
jgi:IS5 family transposase